MCWALLFGSPRTPVCGLACLASRACAQTDTGVLWPRKEQLFRAGNIKPATCNSWRSHLGFVTAVLSGPWHGTDIGFRVYGCIQLALAGAGPAALASLRLTPGGAGVCALQGWRDS